MATMLVLGDVLEFKTFTYLKPQLGLNVFHYIVSAVVAPGARDSDCLGALDTDAGLFLPNILPATGEYFGSTIQKVAPNPIMGRITAVPSALGGAQAGDILPYQCSLVITKQTGLPGRANRGRVYVPFPVESENDASTFPSPAYQAAVAVAYNALLTPRNVVGGGGTLTLTPVVYHRGNKTWTTMTGYRVNKVWGNQRRRGDYGRVNPYPPYAA